eukprot:3928837-Lingulodinium_polyedra.AAC.1
MFAGELIETVINTKYLNQQIQHCVGPTKLTDTTFARPAKQAGEECKSKLRSLVRRASLRQGSG